MDRVLAQADFLAGPYSLADIAFYMAYVFADRKGAVLTDATPRRACWHGASALARVRPYAKWSALC